MVRFVSDVRRCGSSSIAAVLVLVTVALVVIGVASAVALRSSLVDRHRRPAAPTALAAADEATVQGIQVIPTPVPDMSPGPSAASPRPTVDTRLRRRRRSDRRPRAAADADRRPQVDAQLGQPYTARSRGTMTRWRMLITQLPDGRHLVVGESLSDVDSAVDDLVAAELLVGAGVLIVLGRHRRRDRAGQPAAAARDRADGRRHRRRRPQSSACRSRPPEHRGRPAGRVR